MSGDLNKGKVITMSVKISGHEVRANKPIKIYNFFKLSVWVVILSALFLMPAFAAQYSDPMSNSRIAPCGIGGTQ